MIARRCVGCGRYVVIDEQEPSAQHEGDACEWFRALMIEAGLSEHDEPGLFVVQPDGSVMPAAKA
jgi:hypothetical protein